MYYLISILSGILFAAGMLISGMVAPVKVLAFLDIFGDWDPSLAFVMGGALMVFLPTYHLLIKKRTTPLAAERFNTPAKSKIDAHLILGASIFGVGWGLAGLCPGPAITSISSGSSDILLFVVAMLTGMWLMPKVSSLLSFT